MPLRQVMPAEASTDLLLETRELGAIRGEQILFRNINLSVRAGELWLLRGPNGSGKTTLLRMLSGLGLPSAGSLHWRGEPLRRGDDVFLDQMLYLGHANGLKLALTPTQNLEFSQALSNGNGVSVAAALQTIEMTHRAQLPCRMLSAGQRRRVALAQALVGFVEQLHCQRPVLLQAMRAMHVVMH